ncbi:MAG: gliding motility-associated C-terminal domain-containing protein, partial [Bacteroidia bacterium]|nr:gliding motility-associated C-terminal domain-containing protein [Bacteroidia bacterium]
RGNVSEIPNSITCLASGEHRSVWFIFTVQSSGTFGFVICPRAGSTSRDYDFALWDVTEYSNPCEFLNQNPFPLPIRCNFAASQTATSCCGGVSCPGGGLTGLDHTNPQPGTISYNASQPPVMPGLNVEAGRTYVLLVDNFSNNDVGFDITFYGTAQYFDNVPPRIDTAVVGCSDSYDNQVDALRRLQVVFNEMINPSTVAANGSDFTLIDNVTNTPVSIASATPLGTTQTNAVQLQLNSLLVPGRSYTIHVAYNPPGSGSSNGQPGSDGNTIQDQCAIFIPTNNVPEGQGGASKQFVLQDTMRISFDLISPSCTGGNDGKIKVQVTGGLPPFSYYITQGTSNTPPASGWTRADSFTNLTAGTYTVWIRTRTGCWQRRIVNLPDRPPLGIQVVDSFPFACAGRSTGRIQFEGVGGTPPYEYRVLASYPAWQASGTFSNLPVGTHTLQVRDSRGCIAQRTFDVRLAPRINVRVSSMDTVRCYGETGGFVITASGGVGTTLQYTLINPSQTNTTGAFSNLPAGTYRVRVTDSIGCFEEITVRLPQPESLQVQAQLTQPLCLRDRTGAIQTTVSGGNPPYTYTWRDAAGNNVGDQPQLSNVASGTYQLVVRDRKGCETPTLTYELRHQYHAAIRGFQVEPVRSCPDRRMRYRVQAEGIPPLSFVWYWEDGSRETTSSPEAERSYSITQPNPVRVKVEVLSGGNCLVDTTVTVRLEPCLGLMIPTVFTPNNDGTNDTWVIQASGLQRYTVVVYDRWGSEVWTNDGDMMRFWDGRLKGGQAAPEGVYTFYLTGVDNEGQPIQRSGTITLLR